MPDLGTSMTKLKLSRYRSLTPFTVHDVVVSAGVFDAQRSRHRGKKKQQEQRYESRADLTPIPITV
jgi:hypothetical protein